MFGEGGGRIIVSCHPEHLDQLREMAGTVPIAQIGTTGGRTVTLRMGEAGAELHVEQIRDTFESALPKALT